MSITEGPHPQITLPLTTLSEFIQYRRHSTPPSSNTSSSNLSSTTQATSTTSTSYNNTSQIDIKMAFGTRRRKQVVTRETKPTLMTRLRGRNANSRTVKTTTTVHPAHGHAGHSTVAHGTTARRSRWGRNTRTTQPAVHHRRHASIGDKISGAMMKIKGSLTHRPGVKAAGTRRMHGTDGRGSHRVY